MPDNTNDNFHDDAFDELTFNLELRHAVGERRNTARRARIAMRRLARLRAEDEQISFADAWTNIFDEDRMRAELHCSDAPRSQAAHAAWEELDDLSGYRDMQRVRITVLTREQDPDARRARDQLSVVVRAWTEWARRRLREALEAGTPAGGGSNA